MKLHNKNILLISPEPWGINHVSKHHYAIELAKRGNYVYFLNPPTHKFNLQRVAENLIVFDHKSTFRGLSKMPSMFSAWLIKKEVEKLEKFCKATFDIIWNFTSSSFFNLNLLKNKLRISHIVDLSEDKNIKLLNKTADLCLSVSNSIFERQNKFNQNAYNIGHGYANFTSPKSIIIPHSPYKLKVGYIGNLLIKYLDWKLIYTLVKENPYVGFYFAGSFTQSNLSKDNDKSTFLIKTMNASNTFFLGSIKTTQIISFLKKMDVLLLVYNVEEHKKQLENSHKILEYLASGKVIVASWTEEYKEKRELLEMVKEKNSFSSIFQHVINNIQHYNASEKQLIRAQYANRNTYKLKLEEITELLNHKQV